MRISHVPGRLVVNPTAINFVDFEFPFGGTYLGRSKGHALKSRSDSVGIWSESNGCYTDFLESANSQYFECVLREWSSEAVEHIFGPSTIEGNVSQRFGYSAPGTAAPGQSMYSRAVTLLYYPEDPVKDPGTVIYAALPVWTPGNSLALQRSQELGIPVTFQCLPDGDGRIIDEATLADVQL